MELTQQQKLEILCAYLPHGVEALVDLGGINPTKCKLAMAGCNHSRGYFESKHFSGWSEKYKLILRHPDDITEEELIQLGKFLCNDQGLNNNIARENAQNWLKGYLKVSLSPQWAINSTNYLQSIHIDTFGAIEAGFAIRKEI